MSKESKIILAIAAVVVAGVIGLMVATSSSQLTAAEVMDKIVREDSRSVGSGEVQVVEFGDYQCPACAQVNPTVEQLKEEYEGRITFIYRHFPLGGHANAFAAAEAAEAAGSQDKFWEMHRMLFESQMQWAGLTEPTDTFVSYAEQLNLDVDQFKKELEDRTHREKVRSGQSDGYAVGVTGTPTFFINGERQNSFEYDALKSAIEAELE